MTIKHHPDDALLVAFAAGTLDPGQHAAIATHLWSCPRCRRHTQFNEHVGGVLLTNLPPSQMSAKSLASIEARMMKSGEIVEDAIAVAEQSTNSLSLPTFIRKYPMADWQWIAPRVHLRRIELPDQGDTRLFLLRSGPGTKMLQHSHTGIEMTCVLSGAFSHAGGYFGPGDFDIGDDLVDHRPLVDDKEECICLVAMQGELRLNGLLGWAMQSFVRL